MPKNPFFPIFYLVFLLPFFAWGLQAKGQQNDSLLSGNHSGAENDTTVIGFSNALLFHKLPEGPLGNFLSDAVREEAEVLLRKRIDVAYISPNAMRGSIGKGEITLQTIRQLLPFDDSLSVLEIPGSILSEFLDRIAMKGGGPVSGISMQIRNMRAAQVLVGEDSLDNRKIYRILLIERNALGMENFGFLNVFFHQNIPNTLTALVIKYIKKMTHEGRPVNAYFGHRIRYD